MALSLCDFSGDPTSIATEPYFFLIIFRGGGGGGGGGGHNELHHKIYKQNLSKHSGSNSKAMRRYRGDRGSVPPPPTFESHKWLQVF